MRDLSVIIPARNEEFLPETVRSVLINKRADTEVIVVADGYKPDLEPFNDLKIIILPNVKGQRFAVNHGVKLSESRYVMKLDAHCAMDEGFDVKLMLRHRPGDVSVPSMYALYAFDWVCDCGHRYAQGPEPIQCDQCGRQTFHKDIVFEKQGHPMDFWRISDDMICVRSDRMHHSTDVFESMCHLGCAFFMTRKRYFDFGGLDENHDSYGQMGVEIACKAWLSGGRFVVNRSTWFAHLMRNQTGFLHPYPLDGNQVIHAINYSRDLWSNDKWPSAVRKYIWLKQKFA